MLRTMFTNDKNDQLDHVLAAEKSQPYFVDTLKYVAQRRANGITVYPPQKDVFNAFAMTAFDAVKVVILGQDPYHGQGQAHGLCFSVLSGIQPGHHW